MSVYIAGAGGLGRETLDAALAAAVTVSGFLDDRLAGQTVRGLPVISPEHAPRDRQFLVGVAAPNARRRLTELLTERGLQPYPLLVHPRAMVAQDTTFGAGAIVLAGAYVSSGIRAGEHVHVHYNATVGHDAVLGHYVSVYPGANVAGGVHLATGATVGSNACVLQGLTVGEDAFVGAGAVVIHDVTQEQTVAGVPAKVLHGSRSPNE